MTFSWHKKSIIVVIVFVILLYISFSLGSYLGTRSKKREIEAKQREIESKQREIEGMVKDLKKVQDRALNPGCALRALTVIKYLFPQDVEGKEDLVRIGNSADGGYSMLDDFKNVSHAYSLGIGGDWSWDLDIASRGINVSMFDHTISPPVLSDPHLKFYSYGVSYKDDHDNKLLSLESMLKLDNNSNKENLILKMDVEEAEWEVLSRSSILHKFSQISVELHEYVDYIVDNDRFALILRTFENLNKTHQPVWVHAITNNWTPSTHVIYGGVPLPEQIEVTFVKRKEGLKFTKYNPKKKRADVRNWKDQTEILMWWFEGGNDMDFDGLFNAYRNMISF